MNLNEKFEVKSREHQEDVQEQIDIARLIQVNKDIKRVAAEASELTKKMMALPEGEEYDTERDLLAEQIRQLVEEGTQLSNEKSTLLLRTGAVSIEDIAGIYKEE